MKRAIVYGLLLCVWLPGAQQEKTDQDKLAELNRRIQKITDMLGEIKKEKSSILNEIYSIELQAESIASEINKVNILATRTQEAIQVKNHEKERQERKIGQTRKRLKRIIRVLYKMGNLGTVTLLINIGNFDQLFRNYRLFAVLVDYKMDQINEIKQDLAKLEAIKKALQVELARLAALRAEKNRRISTLASFKQEKLTYIKKINQERESHLGLLDELKREAENLNRLINKNTIVTRDVAGNLNLFKGALPWPIAGRVVSSFGKKKNPRFNTYTINNGIEVKPAEAAEIHAVLAGEVIFADYLRGYGNVLIIQHFRNFHSLYGHCQAFFKKKGDQVNQAEVIALAGSSGSASEETLYFEIRENLKPSDPLKWLGQR